MKPLPPITPETAPYWEACNQGRLLIQNCQNCGAKQFYPRIMCSACGATDVTWEEVSGLGEIESYTIMHVPVSEVFADDVPYIAALIRLAEGPVMMANVLGLAEGQVPSIGMPVRVVFEQRCEQAVPQFEPVVA